MTKAIRPRRQTPDPNQMPLIVPESNWTVPTELPDLTRVGVLGLDTENKDDGLAQGRGPGWVYGAGYVCGVGVAWRAGAEIQRIYVPVAHPDTDCFPKDQVARWLKDITLKNRVVFQNAPYDIGWLREDMGVPVPPVVDDVGCMAVMIDETRRPIAGFNKPYSLDAICNWLGVPLKDERLLTEAATVYGVAAGDVKANLWRLPARYVGPYGEQDPASTLEAWERMGPEIEKQDLGKAYQLEMDLIPMVHEMRRRGIRLDLKAAEQLQVKMFARRDAALKRIGDRLRGRVPTIKDIREQKWLTSVFEMEGVRVGEREGRDSFNKEWMRQGYAGRYEAGRVGHWLPQAVAEAKQCHDAAEKFVGGYLLDFAHRGRIHASVNQFKSEDGGTRTHRFSYADPPLQQIPVRGEQFLREWTLTAEIGTALRSLFLPESGEKFLKPDYSQQEYRLIVHYAARLGCRKADEAVEKYRSDPNTDFHQMVVEMTGLLRQRAKDVNFAKSYGAGIDRFMDMTGLPEAEARAVIEKYDGEMPFVKELMDKCQRAAERKGYILMIDGARLHFNRWESTWLDRELHNRGLAQGWPMGDCELEEATSRVNGTSTRPFGAPADAKHPWYGKRLRRSDARKAGNGKIQGSAARMGKIAMRDMWRAGYVPLLQMHDEFPCSVAKEKDGQRIAAIMRNAVPLVVPMRVDEKYGANWGDAAHAWGRARAAK